MVRSVFLQTFGQCVYLMRNIQLILSLKFDYSAAILKINFKLLHYKTEGYWNSFALCQICNVESSFNVEMWHCRDRFEKRLAKRQQTFFISLGQRILTSAILPVSQMMTSTGTQTGNAFRSLEIVSCRNSIPSFGF